MPFPIGRAIGTAGGGVVVVGGAGDDGGGTVVESGRDVVSGGAVVDVVVGSVVGADAEGNGTRSAACVDLGDEEFDPIRKPTTSATTTGARARTGCTTR
jgi:hypothetical protein